MLKTNPLVLRKFHGQRPHPTSLSPMSSKGIASGVHEATVILRDKLRESVPLPSRWCHAVIGPSPKKCFDRSWQNARSIGMEPWPAVCCDHADRDRSRASSKSQRRFAVHRTCAPSQSANQSKTWMLCRPSLTRWSRKRRTAKSLQLRPALATNPGSFGVQGLFHRIDGHDVRFTSNPESDETIHVEMYCHPDIS